MMKIVVFDTETTGLSPRNDEMLQYSAIDGDEQVLLNTYIKPVRATSWPGAEAVNHISPEMVKDAPTLEAVKDQIIGIMSSADLLVGYNLPFDLGFLRQIWTPEEHQARYDVMIKFARFYGQYSEYYEDYKWQKLSTAAAFFDFEFKAHDSLEDCRATLHVYKCLNDPAKLLRDYVTK